MRCHGDAQAASRAVGRGEGGTEGMTTNMAERSRTAETGQCQPQAPGRGERGRDPISRG